MSRPTKSARVLHPKSQTKAEINTRIEVEDTIKGDSEKLEPSSRLNANQKKIFRFIVRALRA